MIKFLRKNIRILLCIALFIFACNYLYSKYAQNDKDEFIGQNNKTFTDVDLVDYHFLATNFAFSNQFPVTGYILKPDAYKINSNKEFDEVYLDMFKKNGPVTSFMRPPLYPFCVGLMYKIFGFKYYYNLRLNVLLLSAIVGFMPFVGFYIWGSEGFFSGILGAAIFLKSTHDNWVLNTMDDEIFPCFFIFLAFSAALLADKKERSLYYLIWGSVFGLALLAKPILVALPIILTLFIVTKTKGVRLSAIIEKPLAFLLGLAFVVLPWTIYINCVQKATVSQRAEWCSKVSAGTAELELSGKPYKEIMNTHKNTNRPKNFDYELYIKLFKNVTKTFWVYHSRTTGFIIITNAFGDLFLSLNNEFCSDGGLHLEWMFLKSSFYRSHFSNGESTIHKVLLFYYNYPEFMYKIPAARILNFFENDAARYFWLSGSLWGLCVMQISLFAIKGKKVQFVLTIALLVALCFCAFVFSKYSALLLYLPLFCGGVFFFKCQFKNMVSMAFPLIWSSLFISMFLITPFTRYMLPFMPVSCLCMIYFSFIFVKGCKDLAFGAPN